MVMLQYSLQFGYLCALRMALGLDLSLDIPVWISPANANRKRMSYSTKAEMEPHTSMASPSRIAAPLLKESEGEMSSVATNNM